MPSEPFDAIVVAKAHGLVVHDIITNRLTNDTVTTIAYGNACYQSGLAAGQAAELERQKQEDPLEY